MYFFFLIKFNFSIEKCKNIVYNKLGDSYEI